MNKKVIDVLIFIALLNFPLYAGINLGGDVVTRYVWRGLDYGNSVSIQPSLSLSFAGFEVGAWASYPINASGSGANENDLYISFSFGPVSFIVTDYYFPEGLSFGDYSDNGAHIIEGSANLQISKFNFWGGYNLHGDADNSFYAEAGYLAYEADDIRLSLLAGLGNKLYVINAKGDPALVNLQVAAAKGPFSVSYILNPDADTSYLVAGYALRL